MCVGPLAPPKPPPMPKPQGPAPTVKAAQAQSEFVEPQKIQDELGDEDKIDTKKKKALEIKAAKEGTKQLGALDPANLPGQGGKNQLGTKEIQL